MNFLICLNRLNYGTNIVGPIITIYPIFKLGNSLYVFSALLPLCIVGREYCEYCEQQGACMDWPSHGALEQAVGSPNWAWHGSCSCAVCRFAVCRLHILEICINRL